jgi:uncharacterized protein
MNTTLVLGASPNPARYAYKAAHALAAAGHDFMLVGNKPGVVAGAAIQMQLPAPGAVETLTLYIGPDHQPAYYEAVAQLKPRRVIFNPGTENPVWQDALTAQGIHVIEACTLVLLATGQYETA